MAAKVVRLQEPILIVASAKQDKRDAVDAGSFNTVVVQVNALVVGTGSSAIQMEHAAVLEENQFEVIGTPISLINPGGPHTLVITTHSRYLRWTASAITGSPVASIDLVMRE